MGKDRQMGDSAHKETVIIAFASKREIVYLGERFREKESVRMRRRDRERFILSNML